MPRRRIPAAAAAVALVVSFAAALPAAAAFFGWQVTNVAAWDVLNVRAGPGTGYQILVGYPDGTPLSLTGNCTGGLDLNQVAGWSPWQQRQAVRYRWCEVWVDPYGNGSFQPGWVYGRYIRPL